MFSVNDGIVNFVVEIYVYKMLYIVKYIFIYVKNRINFFKKNYKKINKLKMKKKLKIWKVYR